MRNYSAAITSYSFPRYIFRLAELYLAAAEAWNEYLDKPDSRVYDSLDKVRQRAGIPKVREAWQSYAKSGIFRQTASALTLVWAKSGMKSNEKAIFAT